MRTVTTYDKYRVTAGKNASAPEDGPNGVFIFPVKIGKTDVSLIAIASDGYGWEHVSIHGEYMDGRKFTPTWEMMSMIKDLFWDSEETVVQFHPRRSVYKNIHQNTLHLWRKCDCEYLLPPGHLV